MKSTFRMRCVTIIVIVFTFCVINVLSARGAAAGQTTVTNLSSKVVEVHISLNGTILLGLHDQSVWITVAPFTSFKSDEPRYYALSLKGVVVYHQGIIAMESALPSLTKFYCTVIVTDVADDGVQADIKFR